MQIAFAAHLPFRRTRASATADGREQRPAHPRPARRGVASDDKAFYACACGYAFTANVSTTVGCPHCGSTQAW